MMMHILRLFEAGTPSQDVRINFPMSVKRPTSQFIEEKVEEILR